MTDPTEMFEPVRIDGIEVPEAVIAKEMQLHPSDNPFEARAQAARALVVRTLLLQEAARLGIQDAEPETVDGGEETPEEAAIRVLLDEALEIPEPDTATCRRYYDNNLARFRSPDLFHAVHILYAAPPEDLEAYAEATRQAESAIERLQSEPALFAAIAKAESACSSAANGGSLGQLARGDTVPEFETFLFNIEEGQLCPVPVKTRYGVHVLRLDKRVEGRQLPFEMVEDKIAGYLRDSAYRRAVHQFIQVLAGRAAIEGIDLGTTDGPLVQ